MDIANFFLKTFLQKQGAADAIKQQRKHGAGLHRHGAHWREACKQIVRLAFEDVDNVIGRHFADTDQGVS